MRLGILFAIATTTTLAQVNTASLTGIIKDPSEAAVAVAKVTAVQTETNIKRSTDTDATGSYFFPVLPIGTYTVTV